MFFQQLKKIRDKIFSSIRTSLIVSFSILILSALLVFLFVSLNYTQDRILNNSISYTTQIIDLINHDIDSYIDYMENISLLVSNNNDVQQYLFAQTTSPEQQKTLFGRIQAQFKTVIESRSDISNIVVFSNSGRSIVNTGNEVLNEYISLYDLEWAMEAIKRDDGTSLSSSHVQNMIRNKYQWVVTLSRAIRNPYTNERAGLFFIDLNYDIISDLCENNSMGDMGYIYILDEDGNVIYHPQQQLIYSGLKEERIQEVLKSDSRYFVTNEGDHSRLYTISKSEKTGWTVVGVAYTAELMKGKEETQLIYLLTAGILLAGAVIIAIVMSSTITKPIKVLKDSMKEVEKGNFESANIELHSKNEIGSLSNSFNVMTQEIQNLMEQNIVEQRQKRKSELKALQSQINPHFLYNTLDSIIWMSEGGKTKEVVLMTSSLAKLMRQSFSNQAETVSIDKEIEYVRSYLTIQKMRYKDKLEFEISIDESIRHAEIVKLVLQPIVENAIYHGIKYKDEIGLIRIEGFEKDGKIVIMIKDNGAGMDKETLEHILEENKENYRSNGVGIYNVHMRLQLYYGPDYGIKYESRLGAGTIATVTIPVRQS